jgi:hypothetical protein
MNWIDPSTTTHLSTSDMAASGEIKASTNMWAILADEEPGDSEAAKRETREGG